MSRTEQALQFLQRHGWGTAQRAALAGDASNRRYERLTLGDRTAVLMDAPVAAGEEIGPFVSIARHLSKQGFSAPDILAEDPELGFLLLEDFGDDRLADLVDDHPELYRAATDVLLALHQCPPPPLQELTPQLLIEMVAPLWVWYHGSDQKSAAGLQQQFSTLFRPTIDEIANVPPVMVLRDYHAENLMYLPDRDGIRQMGLLDFQDAKSGHPAYDLVSLLQDARRDVPPELGQAMIAHYLQHSDADAEAFRTAYAALGLQRNLRILGVLSRLCLQMGKPHYVDFLPRVWRYVQRDLHHPALAPLAEFLNTTLAAPDPARLQQLKDGAAKCQPR